MEELRKRSGRLTEEERETVETNENEQEILTEKDDEELWDENEKIAEVRIGSKSKRRDILRRSVAETGLALLVHFVLLMFYIAIHVHDATMVKRCPDPDKYFVGINTYAGRMKYFTHQTMVRLTLTLTLLLSAFQFDHALCWLTIPPTCRAGLRRVTQAITQVMGAPMDRVVNRNCLQILETFLRQEIDFTIYIEFGSNIFACFMYIIVCPGPHLL